ncbi:hypothetical protein [Caulobacter endophyticus]|uniref:hypothetical protein n=1 Tax=Caulobacter endophyticus TaxID=2172652 RepID=UPI00240F5CE0|nr:hypothetical protein [Caulobacter endophyticus]MDG2530413.1 hypothetical protein [Caulobacter endophyticus]
MFETANQYLSWNQHLAGWAQFVGAMLALIAAYVLAVMPINAQRKDALAAADALDMAAKALLESAATLIAEQVDEVRNNWPTPLSLSLTASRLTTRGDRILAFPHHQLRDQSADGLADRILQMAELFREVFHHTQAPYGGPDRGQRLTSAARDEVVGHLEEAVRKANLLIY